MNLHETFDGSIQEQLCRLQHGVLLPATFNGLPRCLFGGVYADLITDRVNDNEMTASRLYTYSALMTVTRRQLYSNRSETLS